MVFIKLLYDFASKQIKVQKNQLILFKKKDKDCSRFFQNKCLLRRILEKPAIAGVQIAVATLSKFSRYLMK